MKSTTPPEVTTMSKSETRYQWDYSLSTWANNAAKAAHESQSTKLGASTMGNEPTQASGRRLKYTKHAADILVDEQIIIEGNAYVVAEITHYAGTVDITCAEIQDDGPLFFGNDDLIEVV